MTRRLSLLIVTAYAGLAMLLWGYRRADWPHWMDADHNCRDTRQEVLARDARPGSVTWDAAGCHVTGGTWIDPYTGDVVTNPAALDVDHVVPLGWAEAHGGAAWSTATKAAYANDLTYRGHLLAVRLTANRAKGDRGPEAWIPANPADLCHYGEQWATILVRWHLQIPEVTRAAIMALVTTC